MKYIQTWLLMAIIAIGANGEVNAKPASGLEKIKSSVYVEVDGLQTVDAHSEKHDARVGCMSGELLAGQYFDKESGLHYNRHRYYDPESSQYLSSDPIGLAGGLTPQSYVHNPNGWVDPLGLAKSGALCKGGAHRSTTKPVGDKLDSHHMPDRNADPRVHANDGPAIKMDPHDHHLTSSNGRNGRAGQRYRQETADMIAHGRYRDAMAREIRDVRRAAREGSGTLTKYNEHISEMLEYAKKSGQLPLR